MILCITEKPSVARDIAAILGANHPHPGFIEGNGYCVTWTFGHLCMLKEPADYSEAWKRWSLSSLPMIPPRFGIKLIGQQSIKKQFKVIEELAAKASEVINCGDAGQEGELIQRWVMQKAKVKCPVKRLWISSLTDESIREGFKNLMPEADFDNLYMAGLSRAVGDWLLGMNATRLFSLKYSVPGRVLSIGRVQTPTLAIVVERQKEIDNFVAKPFWEFQTKYRDATFNGVDMRFESVEKANEILATIIGKPLRVDSVEKKKGKEAPPRLFDLTSLQVECNKRWGWSADTSLKLIQTLYEKKVTTYPRVDTTYLPDDIYPKVPDILRRMTPYAPITAPLLAGKLPKSKKVFDNSKVTDHHAIIPTGQSPTTLSGDEKKMYHLIALRFIAAFYPDCKFTATVVNASVESAKFRVNGKVIDEAGWKALYAKEKSPGDGEDTLPAFEVGESGPHEPEVVEKTTQPPKYFTEGTLLRAMETAGRNIDDEELREAMKENGIGRPSTRAAIIEILIKRGYIVREKKSLRATEAGKALIDLIKVELVKSPRLTGIWENRLRMIERGTYQASEFAAQIKQMVNEIVLDVLADNQYTKIYSEQTEPEAPKQPKARKRAKSDKDDKPAKPRRKAIRKLEDIVCPACGQGYIIKGRTAYGCSRYKEGCKALLPFDRYDSELTPAKLYNKMKPLYGKD